MALKLLLADGNSEWLGTASKYFKDNMYEVTTVENGKDTQLAIYNNKYFAVILNYSIQNHSGAQVLKFIKTNYPGQKIILVIDEDSVDISKFKKMGISEIVVKPFSMEQLHNILEGHQSFGELMSQLPKRDGVSEEVEVQEQDDGFTKIKIDEFFSAGSVLFDIFIKLAANRYVKILHSGDKFDDERINKYKNEKGVEYLYFRSKDRKKMIQFFNHLSKKITENDVIQTSTKINFLKNMTTQYIEEVYN